ncbi:MAG: hypothetical protein EXQ69_03340 [Acidimicrobiia bacterium]|nr:hypothetical protein [Acidimicrobiia bacterium]
MSYCRSCGTALNGTAFCRACGAAGGTKSVADHTKQAVPTMTQPAVAATPGNAAPKRNGSRAPWGMPLTMAAVGALAVVVTLLAVSIGDSESKTAKAPRRASTERRVTTSSTTTTTEPDAVRPEMENFELLLTDSGTARKALNDTILGPFRDCELTGAAASDRMDAIIDNRTRIRDRAAVLAQHDDATVRDLGAKLQAALQASLDSNYKYQTWMGEYRYNYTCPSAEDPMVKLANIDSDRATTAKQIFVNTYNQIASQYGLRTWTDLEI